MAKSNQLSYYAFLHLYSSHLPEVFFVLGSFNFLNLSCLLEICIFMIMKLQDGEYKSFWSVSS